MRYAPAPGLNNAFWLHSGKAEKVFEIDINEGHWPHYINMTLHQEGKESLGKKYTAEEDLSVDFHNYAVEWNDKELIFYLDGREIDRKPHEFAHTPCPVIFSTAVLQWAGPTSAKLDGGSMDVDWVRVYQKKDSQ